MTSTCRSRDTLGSCPCVRSRRGVFFGGGMPFRQLTRREFIAPVSDSARAAEKNSNRTLQWGGNKHDQIIFIQFSVLDVSRHFSNDDCSRGCLLYTSPSPR